MHSPAESGAVREELGKFQSTQLCETCKGTRLNAAARNVFVQERPLPEIANLSVTAALEFFAQLSLKGWRAEIAAKIVTEIHNRLKFLADVGLGYLSLEGMLKAAGSHTGFCHACFSGQYPTPIPEDLVQLRHASPLIPA